MVERPTDMLRREHVSVLEKLDQMEILVLRPDGEKSTQLKELAGFFHDDFWVHFAKEEDALFPEMETFIPRDMGPIGVMLAEHEDLRKTNAGLQKAVLAHLSSPDAAAPKAILRDHGLRFISVLRDHIHKEDNILFMMAEMHLLPEQMEKVAEQFQVIETKLAAARKA